MKNTQRGFIMPLLLALIAILLVGGGVYVYTQNKQAGQPAVVDQTPQQTTSTAQTPSSQTVGPLTIKPLMPVVEMDQPSTAYKNSITLIQSQQLENIKDVAQLRDSILKSDSEIKSRTVDNHNYLFNILYANSDESFVLYMMTSTGTSCTLPGEMGSGCDNAKLKILNTKDNSISLLTDNFGSGQGDIYLDEKDNSIIVFTGSNYQIFNLSK